MKKGFITVKEADRLCARIERIFNSVFLGGALLDDKDFTMHNELIDLFKEVGFRFDYTQPTKFSELKL